MSRNLIVSIDVGPVINWADITVPKLHAYAKKVDADLQIITGSTFGTVWDETHQCEGHPSFFKIPLTKWFAKQDLYDRMLFIDADVVVKGSAGNIFQECPLEGAYYAEDMGSVENYAPWREWANKFYPGKIIPDDWVYRNNGIFLMDRKAAANFSEGYDRLGKFHARWLEQCASNIVFSQSGLVHMMPVKYNWPCPFKTKEFASCDFAHLCGCDNGNKRLWIRRMDQAEKNGYSKLKPI